MMRYLRHDQLPPRQLRNAAVTAPPQDEIISFRVVGDLTVATGQQITPVDAHVQRWGGALPQYAVGHLDRVARIRAAVDAVPGLEVCGAAYDGVGIPAVVGSARRAAAALLAAGT